MGVCKLADNERKRLDEIRRRKQARQRSRRIRLTIVIAAFVAVLAVIVMLVKGITSFVAHNRPTPTPTPVAIVSQSGTPENTESTENTKNTEAPSGENPTETLQPEPQNILPPASEENDILKIFEKNPTDKKVCYLTFDDGPNNSITPRILDTLRKYGIKATFFQVGSLIKENTDMARRVYEEGHLIAGHSYTHTYSKLYATAESFTDEINSCEAEIKNVVGDDFFPLIRFPGGSFNAGTYGERKQQYKSVLAQMGYYHCDWNALNGDAEGGSKSVEQLVERVKSSSKNKNKVVILMHDAANKKNTAEALPQIIEYFISQGYTFSRLDKPIY